MLVGAFNQEKALVEAFPVITNLRMDLRFKLYPPPAAGRAIYVFAGECLRVLRRFQSGRGFWLLPPVTAR